MFLSEHAISGYTYLGCRLVWVWTGELADILYRNVRGRHGSHFYSCLLYAYLGCRLVCVLTGELVEIIVWAGLRAAWVTFLFLHLISRYNYL
jgi:hypothetical protein